MSLKHDVKKRSKKRSSPREIHQSRGGTASRHARMPTPVGSRPHWIKRGENFNWQQHRLDPSELSLNARTVLWLLARLSHRLVSISELLESFHHFTKKSRKTLRRILDALAVLNLVEIHDHYHDQVDRRKKMVMLSQEGLDFARHYQLDKTHPEKFGLNKHHSRRLQKIVGTLMNRQKKKHAPVAPAEPCSSSSTTTTTPSSSSEEMITLLSFVTHDILVGHTLT